MRILGSSGGFSVTGGRGGQQMLEGTPSFFMTQPSTLRGPRMKDERRMSSPAVENGVRLELVLGVK